MNLPFLPKSVLTFSPLKTKMSFLNYNLPTERQPRKKKERKKKPKKHQTPHKQTVPANSKNKHRCSQHHEVNEW